jgi:GxxExxY protein
MQAIHKQLGYEFIGAALEVFHTLGGGMLEEVYQQALEYELSLRDIPFSAKKELRITYKGKALDKLYIPDLFIKDEIIVELKSVKELTSEHIAQLLNYMRITNTQVGYLVNFGSQKQLEWKRFVL